MYKFERYRQLGLADFNQPVGLKMNPENRWVKKASTIPWNEIESKYAELFPSKTGMPAKPLRMALGSLLIQKQLGFSDRELVEEITENPHFQFFLGLPGYQTKAPFVPSLLAEFGKRLTEEILGEINEMIIDYNTPDDPTPGGGSDDHQTSGEQKNEGTLILDAACVPQNIAYPQDIRLLNEARENLEDMVDSLCAINNQPTPRMYRNNARRDCLNLAKSKKRTVKRVRRAIKQQLAIHSQRPRVYRKPVEQWIRTYRSSDQTPLCDRSGISTAVIHVSEQSTFRSGSNRKHQSAIYPSNCKRQGSGPGRV